MFSFLPVIHNLVIIGSSFLLQSISAIISSKTTKILFLIWIVFFSVSINIIKIMWVLNKSFRIIKCFVRRSSRFLIKNYFFAAFRSLAYKLLHNPLFFAFYWSQHGEHNKEHFCQVSCKYHFSFQSYPC